jgi:hypothetical protein
MTSEPGQDVDAVRRPCRIAVIHAGSPPHERGSLAVFADIVKLRERPIVDHIGDDPW